MEQQKTASGLAMWLAGAALGAATMYFSDPRQGRRRRALLRDKLYSMSLDALDTRDATMRDLGNRIDGMRAKFWRAVEGREPPPGENILCARLRTMLGRLVSHPHAITVTADGGHVVLSGAILAGERETLLAEAYKVPGVTAIEDRLSVYASPAGVPALQGRHRVASQAEWQPALRALAGAGGILGTFGLTRRSPGGWLLAGAGLAVLGRAVSALRQNGSRQEREQSSAAWHLERSIEVLATPEAVFDAWSDFENFPHFFTRVLTATPLDEQRSRWALQETAASRLEGNVMWRKRERPRMLAWHSEDNAAFALAGTVTLEPTRSGTRVTLRLAMPPQPGASQAEDRMESDSRLYKEFGRELEKDLLRMKSFIESGVVPHHATGSARPEGGQLLH